MNPTQQPARHPLASALIFQQRRRRSREEVATTARVGCTSDPYAIAAIGVHDTRLVYQLTHPTSSSTARRSAAQLYILFEPQVVAIRHCMLPIELDRTLASADMTAAADLLLGQGGKLGRCRLFSQRRCHYATRWRSCSPDMNPTQQPACHPLASALIFQQRRRRSREQVATTARGACTSDPYAIPAIGVHDTRLVHQLTHPTSSSTARRSAAQLYILFEPQVVASRHCMLPIELDRTLASADMTAAADLLLGQGGKPSLDLVDPGAVGGRRRGGGGGGGGEEEERRRRRSRSGPPCRVVRTGRPCHRGRRPARPEAGPSVPHGSPCFKLSRDPRFVEKLTDIVGLYLDPPEKALVLCMDERWACYCSA